MNITYNDFLNFHKEFYNGKYPHQRFGQAFCNKFDIEDQSLFYQENDEFAKGYIIKNHIHWE